MWGAGAPPTPHPADEGFAPGPKFVTVFLLYLPKLNIWIQIILKMWELIATRGNYYLNKLAYKGQYEWGSNSNTYKQSDTSIFFQNQNVRKKRKVKSLERSAQYRMPNTYPNINASFGMNWVIILTKRCQVSLERMSDFRDIIGETFSACQTHRS